MAEFFMIQKKKILIGITGSIAAYKIPLLVRLLVKAGAEVKVIMTTASHDFVAPLTLSTLTKNEVLTELSENSAWANHVMLGRWADVFLIAPLTCNTLAKLANGLCDNLLTAVYLSSTCPVLVAPAMDEDMWHHPSIKRNIELIETYGNRVIPVENGDLASGLTGEGRMAELETIILWINNLFMSDKPLEGINVLVSAGPTYEALDPVRFIGNYSSGKMGLAIARELLIKGAKVTVVLGPSVEKLSNDFTVVRVKSAEDMYSTCISLFPKMDIAIMSAAVADYTPVTFASEKIKKSEDVFTINLKKTKDILKQLGTIKKEGQLLIGFALETNNEREYALKKLSDKNADMIILNSLNDEGAGFGIDTNKVTIFDKKGNEYKFETKLKTAVASDIVHTIINYKP
jgi:phosphopantothenoylcysteine decarboxylase/phosphopantothenate--cysteine ligase